MNRRACLAAAGSLAAVAVSGCSEVIPSPAEQTPAPDSDEWTVKPSVEGTIRESSDSDLVVEEHDFALADDDVRVRGRVTNTGPEQQPVTVTAELFRGDDVEVPAAERETNHDGLGAGEGWSFAFIFGTVDGPEISRYALLTD